MQIIHDIEGHHSPVHTWKHAIAPPKDTVGGDWVSGLYVQSESGGFNVGPVW